ncbi:phosphonoacetaldehyde hydrolase [bacterium]|nr:phosphonoacetaldehyde hydrolase [bacterium]
MLPKLVVFDMAGTTVHDADFVNHAVVHGFASKGVEISTDQINPLMGIPKPIAIARVLEQNGDDRFADAIFVDEIHEVFLAEMLRFYHEDPRVREIDGASQVFRVLREHGVKIALDTGFSRPIADVILDRLGWGERVIDFSVTSDEVARGRPFPDMIESAMRVLDVEDAALVAKVGDTPSDMEQGHAAGCGWVIGVWEGTHTREQLLDYDPTHLVANVRQVATDVFGLAI